MVTEILRKKGPSPWLASMVPRFMAKTSVVPKKKRGPAPTGKGVQVGERWHPSELAAIDAWIAASNDKALTRAHAIRRLVALGLKGKRKELSRRGLPSNRLRTNSSGGLSTRFRRGRRYRTAKPSQNFMQTTNALEQKGWRERQSSSGLR